MAAERSGCVILALGYINHADEKSIRSIPQLWSMAIRNILALCRELCKK